MNTDTERMRKAANDISLPWSSHDSIAAADEIDRLRACMLRIQSLLREGNPAITDTIWLGPAETMLDAVDEALGNIEHNPSTQAEPLWSHMMTTPNPECGCAACNPNAWWMIVCDKCGNKRCPHAADHRYLCTGSNTPNQTPTLA